MVTLPCDAPSIVIKLVTHGKPATYAGTD